MVVRVYTRCYTIWSNGNLLMPHGKSEREEEEGRRRRTESGKTENSRSKSGEKEGASNKNTNRNKVGFAFDKHRKKAQRKVITYTSANYDRPTPRCSAAWNTSFAVAQAETQLSRSRSTTESRGGLRKKKWHREWWPYCWLRYSPRIIGAAWEPARKRGL